MDIFVEVSTSQIVTPTPTIPLRLDDVAQFVSLQANDINEGEFDGNLEGDEFDEEFATLDENLIVIEEDGDDDLVFVSAPIVEFNKVDPLDEDELNSWKTWESMVRYEKGKEFAVGQVFTNKASISDEVTFYSVQANQFFKVGESKPDTVTYKCGRSPSPCNWRLRATRKDPYSQAFTIVTYKGPHDSSSSNMKARDIGGPLILLQLWAWERITIARPIVTGPENPPLIQGPYPLGSQHQLRVDSLGRRWLSVHRRRPQGTTITTLLGYRDALDNMRPDQFVWQPYPQAIFSFLPEACYNDSGEWCVVSPMICFDIVEWHLPNRVARQFGWKQNIPEPADTEPKLHKMDKRGAHSRNWAEYHSAYLAMWFRRYQFRFIGVEDNSDMGYNDPYMAHGFAEVHRTCNTEIQAMPQEVPPHYRNIMSNIRDNTSQSLEHVGYSHLLQQFHQPTQETQVEEQHEERGDGSTMQESTAEDDETLQVFRRRSRRTNTSMSPINEQGTPEPSKAKKIWSRLRGKKKT
ncbi:hypothetical protein KSS87_011496 [Heliosperma pusillum]|nr:hypothetical protein KSS87_011496 [Heliosperma pusillum]